MFIDCLLRLLSALPIASAWARALNHIKKRRRPCHVPVAPCPGAHADARVGVLVKGLRAAVSKLLAAKIKAPHLDVGGHPVMGAITRLIITNGM